MKISEIYKKYNIPPNLIDHMFTVARVALFISDHWVGSKLDRNRLLKIALLHDLGNIVKFDFDKHPEFLGKEIQNIAFWKGKQKEIIAKYGRDDHKATTEMLKQIGLSEEDIDIASSKSFGNSVATKESKNWTLKILLYSDLRVLPFGVGTLEERFQDMMSRMPQYNKRPDIEDLFQACREIEKQIQNNVNVSLATINAKSIKEKNENLLNIEI